MIREKITGAVTIPYLGVKSIFDFAKKIELSLSGSTSETIAILLAGSIYLNASDIHIEPEEERAKFRVRIDGMLHDVMFLDIKIYKNLVSRIKLLSGLKLNIANKPQDGRFTINLNEVTMEIRTSTLPAEYGESVVLRILNPKNLIEIEALGLRKDLVEIFEKEIGKPNGMLIVTGPTGSGKTTTLYAILKKINTSDVKIITIEDPVEYHLEGISQTQVDPAKGYTFASGLRSLMRQDPDVILVGEIRDQETAEIALQAALTGHLVFSTLHTNDAAGAIARLIDLGVRPVSIAPAINMVVAQRLPRKVCSGCVQFTLATEEETRKIKQSLNTVKKDLLPQRFFEKNIKLPRAQKCELCNFTGYKGRIGVYETFLVDDEMERFILKSPSIVDMRDLAVKKGMVLMKQDGLIKVLEGTTTIEEIERVVGE